MPKVKSIYSNVLEDPARNHCTNINTEFPIAVTSCLSITERSVTKVHNLEPFSR